MPRRFEWDDVRFFLATLRAPSLRAVADELGVTHATAGRRLGALEGRLGLTLFHRRPDGLHPTAEAHQLQPVAEQVERSMMALERAAEAADPALRGPIRVSMPQAVATDLLMPDLVAFAQRWPDIELHVQSSSAISDLAAREADVAVRIVPLGQTPADELTGRKAATAWRAIYGTGAAWIGWTGRPQSLGASSEALAALPVRGFMEDIALQRAACEAGLGLARLPCFFADGRLPRRSEPEPAGDIWVLVHPDLRRSPRLRMFRDALVAALRAHQPRLAGEAAPENADQEVMNAGATRVTPA